MSYTRHICVASQHATCKRTPAGDPRACISERDARWGGWVGLRCREVHEAEPSARGDVWTRRGKVDQNLDLDLDLDLDLAGGGGGGRDDGRHRGGVCGGLRAVRSAGLAWREGEGSVPCKLETRVSVRRVTECWVCVSATRGRHHVSHNMHYSGSTDHASCGMQDMMNTVDMMCIMYILCDMMHIMMYSTSCTSRITYHVLACIMLLVEPNIVVLCVCSTF